MKISNLWVYLPIDECISVLCLLDEDHELCLSFIPLHLVIIHAIVHVTDQVLVYIHHLINHLVVLRLLFLACFCLLSLKS